MNIVLLPLCMFHELLPEYFSHLTPTAGDVCITFPLAKFTKKPYSSSDSRASQPFSLVHINIWGAYRVPTKGHYRYFLTIVDVFSRVTWIQLLKQKHDFFFKSLRILQP